MGRKLIFLDIDGTFTEPGSNEAPASAAEAVRRAREMGNLVFLCSGRNYGMLSPVLKYGFDGYIASSGGYIVCGDQVIYDCPMTKEQQKRAMDVLEKNGIFRTVECLDGSYTDESFKEFLREHAGEGGNSELLRWRQQIEKNLRILPMEEYEGQPIYKMVIMSRSLEDLDEPKKALEEDFSFCIQDVDRYGIINGEIVNRQFDKGRGVERVCRHLNVPIADTIAFGDSMNDIEMMETAGLSICMENGSQKLKELADEVCGPVDEDGLYRAFLAHGLMADGKKSENMSRSAN